MTTNTIGYIQTIGGTVCLLVKDSTGRYFATGRTVEGAFKRLAEIKAQ